MPTTNKNKHKYKYKQRKSHARNATPTIRLGRAESGILAGSVTSGQGLAMSDRCHIRVRWQQSDVTLRAALAQTHAATVT